ncbi:MAG: TetR/AcrR family transcriptional regulator [Nonomuraea sp.]|uniref:TetR/AcrR family transcriptional regulator n=1 Tax=Hamadaea sp. TaxID=2024425 RepID=UPI0017E30EE3|nr:TetR/AcrR family transcriptional regulator [Hamadaea sp.]NUP82363.1 TetR/AcrR family transcriptional regulator [Nonomuraea sp.]NUR70656.1 TetR/AcrR family transcriptional regulator [Hamadaea sp.]NUT23430.1 TetR/AcrR family transcriptional regulator [Hamadaea sp.]
MPQHSNRAELIDGVLRCLERLPWDRVTAREITAESGANLASITYHFGSKDALLTAAVVEGLDRWLAEIAAALAALAAPGAAGFPQVATVIAETRRRHEGLARMFVTALARAQHDDRVRELLTEGFRRSRADVARVLGLGADASGTDAGGVALALFDGLLIQALLHPDLAIDGDRLTEAERRLRDRLPV